ncbi:hypothetical protein LTR53_011896 [Teratosphaeriaceae sp. CCFEE 6253]|nr:hypothetical protein LTR53_011896 [Teratosphaeriaceae sp. CCFEE 6253]
MDCFHDFCLACDKESHGPYCSQSCRMADLERASPSTLPSPSLASSSTQQLWTSPSSTSTSAYALQPAYDFSDPSTTTTTTTSGSQSANADMRPHTSYFMRYPAEQEAAQRSLTPSSSRSSLSSTSSNAAGAGGLSQQSRQELNGYFNSFKAPKRRPSLK